ncbi:hypothetical protein [Luteibacter yeojuensis]
MNLLPTATLHRIASTFLVLLALFVVCAGVQAMPCERHASSVMEQQYASPSGGALDDVVDLADQDPVPSIEDNGGGLDDTFDVPPQHVVTVPHLVEARPQGTLPAPRPHHPSLDLRPPIG